MMPSKATLASLVALAALAAATAAPLGAQTRHASTAAPTSAAAITRAQEMIGDGDAAGGRALLDSLLAALPAGARETPAVLVARAAAADEPAEAARDYRRVVVEFPTAAEAPDATYRLAQLELQGGERDRALARLARLVSEQPPGIVRARASYLAASTYLEANDLPHGCAALADARAALGPGDVEVRNQVEYYTPRCRDVTLAAAPVPNENAAATTEPPVADETTAAAAPVKPATKPAAKPATSATKAAASKTATKSAKATTAPAASAARVVYTVQVAAVAQRASAALLVKKLRASGYDARIEGSAPYRVRIGRYATHAAADAVAGRLRARKTPALVVEAARR